jgi:hypothetical protein
MIIILEMWSTHWWSFSKSRSPDLFFRNRGDIGGYPINTGDTCRNPYNVEDKSRFICNTEYK